jgi:hypothetical protein
MKQKEINTKYGNAKSYTNHKIHVFLNKGWIVKLEKQGAYEVILPADGYVVNNNYHRNSEQLLTSRVPVTTIPEEIASYLRANYHTTPRSKLAKHLGISKYLLNNYLIGMRLGS